MGDIAKTRTPITEEATRFRSAVSESLMQIIGGDINFLLAAVLPIGSIIHSVLTEEQFQDATGSDDWILADGRDISSSDLAVQTGITTCPDLRGVFLRGRNNGRSSGTGNTAGEVAIGGYESDRLKSHTHTVSAGINESGGPVVKDDGSEYAINTGRTTSDASIGAAETSPRAVTVNIFIRIN